jgi:hypothetical protein
MSQLSLFDALRAPPIIRRVKPNGHVLQGEPQLKFELSLPRHASPAARIEVHPSKDGLWTWSASYNTGYGASGYKVGFAHSADDALHYAIEELRGRLSNAHHYNKAAEKVAARILVWADSLTLDQPCHADVLLELANAPREAGNG